MGRGGLLCPPSSLGKGIVWYMENILAVLILAILVGGAAAYLVRSKRNGVKCVGCPAGGNCSNRHKKKKPTEPVAAKKNIIISGMHCALCAQNVTDSLNQIDGVSAKINLSKGCAEVFLGREVGEDSLITAVEKAGFSVDSIRY